MATEYKIPLQRFDTNLLPPDARQVGTEAFKLAVGLHFMTEYAQQGQTAVVTIDERNITVTAFSAADSALSHILPTLRAGKLKEAVPYLESLSRAAPTNAAVFYNLGIAYSELSQYDEAIIRLKRAVSLDPEYTNAWVGIGTAYSRAGKPELALEAFEKAVQVDPDNGHARRNLGGMLIGSGRVEEAIVHLRRALELMADDPQTIFGLAAALEELETEAAAEEADELYLRVINEHGNSNLVGDAQKARTAFAQRLLKAKSIGGVRPDVMMYIAGALKLFREVGPTRRNEIAVEIAILGSSGLDINEPVEKYRLKSLPGTFTGLRLLSIMYAAYRQIDPKLETGADFAAEYEAAEALDQRREGTTR